MSNRSVLTRLLMNQATRARRWGAKRALEAYLQRTTIPPT
jgi:hypothetical protein